MLRIFFSADDIARTRLATAPDPLWELVLSVQMLRGQRGDLLFAGWRRETASALRNGNVGPDLRLLMQLCPEIGYFPDFLNPAEARLGLDHGLEAIRRTPKSIFRRDMTYLAQSQRKERNEPLIASAARLAGGSTAAVATLTRTMRSYYDVAISPHSRSIDRAVGHDRDVRLKAFTEGGVEGLLASMSPMMHWTPGVLSVPQHRDQEIRLGGRGLVLIPSFFAVNQPMTMFDPQLPPVLIYPVPRTAETVTVLDEEHSLALSALIGQTRAAMLEAIQNACSTTDLAKRAGVSPASASEHASIMRAAQLIRSHRDGNRMIHELTPLGHSLLNGA